MTEKEIEKIVNGFIMQLPIGRDFSFMSELQRYFKSNNFGIDLNERKNNNLLLQVRDFMVEHQYINLEEQNDDILEQKGIDAKNAGGHFKYLESLKPKKEYWFTKYQFTSIILTLLFGSWGAYNEYQNNKLKDEYLFQGQKLDSVNAEFEKNLLLLDSLIIENELLKKEMLNDSLRTKNVSE